MEEDEALQNALMQSAAEQKGNDEAPQNMHSDSNTNSSGNGNVNQSGNGNSDLMSSILGALSGGGNVSGNNGGGSGHSEQDVATLMNLGYSRPRAVEALTACGGNVEMAASWLFQNAGGGLGF